MSKLKEIEIEELMGMFRETPRELEENRRRYARETSQPEENYVSIEERINRLARKADYLVVFENQQLDSSECGRRQVLGVGPGFTCETLEAAAEGHLNDLPSQRQYPVSYVDCRSTLA